MRKRTEDWRDLLSAYSLALDAKKISMGLLATVATVAVMALAALLYAQLLGDARAPDALALLGTAGGEQGVLWQLMRGTGLKMLGAFLPLFNPFHGGLGHFILSSLMYVALFWVWSGPAGVVSRLTALEYARDDLPTLAEAREMVRSKRKAYFLAPLMPFVAVLFLCGLNILGGFIASLLAVVKLGIIGRLILIFPGFPLLVASTVVIVFLIVLGALSFGLMMPAVSVGGKDGFESWSTAYSYVLWGLRRFVCYSLVAGVIGAVSAVVACWLGELLIYVIYKTVDIGNISSAIWLAYGTVLTEQGASVAVMPAAEGISGVLSGILALLFLLVRAVPVAYVFSYVFTANTIIFFLMRKEQDNIDVDEIYEEEEEEAAEALEEEPTADISAPAQEPAEPAEPQTAEPEEEIAAEEEGEAPPAEGEDAQEQADEEETS